MYSIVLISLFTAINDEINLEDLGDYYFYKNEYKKALKIYKMAKNINPTIKEKIGLCYYMIEDYENAEKWGVPNYMYINKGILALKDDNFELALKYFTYAKYNYGIGYANYKIGKINEAKNFFIKDSCFYPLGVIYYEEGKYDSAMEYFMRTKNTEEVGFCFYMMNKYKEAIENLSNPLYLAECYYMLKNYNEAAKYYEKAPKSKDALYGAGFCYYKLKEFDKSAEKFASFIDEYGKESKVLYYLARANQRNGKVKNSIYYFNEFINNYPNDELIDEAYYWLGKAYFSIGDYENCKKTLNILTEKYPESELKSYAYSIIGDIYYNNKEYNIAVDYYDKVETPSWLLDNARLKKERCYLGLKKYKSEEEVFLNFLNKYPNSPSSAKIGIELAQHLIKKLKFNEAIKVYNKIIKDYSWSVYAKDAKFNLADVYFRLGEYDSAIAVYKTLLNTNAANEAQLYIAEIYFDIGEYGKATEEYKKLINSEYESEALYKIGLSYFKSDKMDEAKLYFNNFINKNDPQSNVYWEVYLNLAKIYLAEGNIDDYIKTLMFIKDKAPIEIRAEVFFLLGNIYFDKADYIMAKKFFIEASHLCTGDTKAKAIIKAANCAKLLNSNQEAIELLEKVRAINPILEKQVKEELKKLAQTKVNNLNK